MEVHNAAELPILASSLAGINMEKTWSFFLNARNVALF